MPWKKRDLMALKKEFLEKALIETANISALCKEHHISRKTAYKWIKRFKQDGINGLLEQSKRPLISPSRISEESLLTILETRNEFSSWGGRKLRQYLVNLGKKDLPSEATFNRILLRHGKIDPIESEKREPFIRFEKERPNELWQMDFKGHFKLLEEGRCHPLTILDDHSRFSICLMASNSESEKTVREGLEKAFKTYGMPDAMTMDNGSPWKGSPPWTLSRITVWLMRLGIKVSHSRPGHPQTQGKLERFHRSFKEEVLKYYQFKDLKDAQTRFDEWKELYNYRRPHEGIGMKCPKDRYQKSDKSYLEQLPSIEYLESDEIRKVGPCGTISYKDKQYFIGEHLYKEHVALREVQNGLIDVYYVNTKVQRINLKTS